MATYNIGNRKHLTLADRAAIEHGIQIGENFSQIARKLNKDSSTISKEIRRHIIHVPHYQDDLQKKRSECQFFHSCDKRNVCGNLSCRSLCFKCRSKRCAMYCRAFTPVLCDRLKKPPYVCNNCNQIRTCSHDFYFYRAHYAHDLYNEIKVSSRSGINQTPESLEQLDQLVSPFLLKGQPLSHIYASNQQHQHTGPCDQQHSCSFFHPAPPPVHVYDGDILLCKKHTNQMSRHPNSCVL